jgi:hypothetical protein
MEATPLGKVTDSDTLGILFGVLSISILDIMLPVIWRIVNILFLKLMLFSLYFKMVYLALFY